MTPEDVASASLYGLLAAWARDDAPMGETTTTRQKETLDNDAEELDPHVVADSTYDLLGTVAVEGAGVGETRMTKTIETIDEDPNDHNDAA